MLEAIDTTDQPRIADWILADLAAALDALRTADVDSEIAIHSARKRLKRVRTLLSAIKAADPHHHAARLEPVKSAFQSLAGSRDADAMLAAAKWLTHHTEGSTRDDAAQVVARLKARIHILKAEPLPMAAISAQLDLAGRVTAAFQSSVPTTDVLTTYLVTVYCKGRKRFRHAQSAEATDDEALHDWRKMAKHWLYIGQMLVDLKPTAKVFPLKELDRLTEFLGEEHDFANLAAFVASDTGVPVDARRIARLTDAITRRRAKLAARSFDLGAELYAEKPTRFERRL
jgi:CHAD domain-containing protein